MCCHRRWKRYSPDAFLDLSKVVRITEITRPYRITPLQTIKSETSQCAYPVNHARFIVLCYVVVRSSKIHAKFVPVYFMVPPLVLGQSFDFPSDPVRWNWRTSLEFLWKQEPELTKSKYKWPEVRTPTELHFILLPVYVQGSVMSW